MPAVRLGKLPVSMRPGVAQGVGDGGRVAVAEGVATAVTVAGKAVSVENGIMVEGETAVGKGSSVAQPNNPATSKIKKIIRFCWNMLHPCGDFLAP